MNERAADVVIANQSQLERDAAFLRVAERRGIRRIRHAENTIRIHTMFAGQLSPERAPRAVNRYTPDLGIRAGKINQLEDARRNFAGRRQARERDQHAVFDFHDLSGTDLFDQLRANQIERTGLAGKDKPVALLSDY
jgi:hypothetical protein